MGQKPGLSRLETAGASQAGREGPVSGHQRRLVIPTLGVFSCLSMATEFTCKHQWGVGELKDFALELYGAFCLAASTEPLFLLATAGVSPQEDGNHSLLCMTP